MGTLETGARRGVGWVWQGSGADPTDTGPADRTRIRCAWIDNCALSVRGACAPKWRRTGVVEGPDKRRKGGREGIVESRCDAIRCDAEMKTADTRREEVDYCQNGGRNATTGR